MTIPNYCKCGARIERGEDACATCSAVPLVGIGKEAALKRVRDHRALTTDTLGLLQMLRDELALENATEPSCLAATFRWLDERQRALRNVSDRIAKHPYDDVSSFAAEIAAARTGRTAESASDVLQALYRETMAHVGIDAEFVAKALAGRAAPHSLAAAVPGVYLDVAFGKSPIDPERAYADPSRHYYEPCAVCNGGIMRPATIFDAKCMRCDWCGFIKSDPPPSPPPSTPRQCPSNT